MHQLSHSLIGCGRDIRRLVPPRRLIPTTQQRSAMRDNVIVFFDQIAGLPHLVPRIILLDNAAIQKEDVLERKRRRWQKQEF
jgi:hypothetical protein